MLETIVDLETQSCPNGCVLDDTILLTGRDRLHNLPGQFFVVKCNTCGLMRTNPRPTAESIGFYYPDDYGPYLGTQVSKHHNDQTSSLSQTIRKVVKKIIDFQTDKIPNLPAGKMLEIGCASGRFMHKMAQLDWQVEGLEFSETAATQAQKLGYPVYTGALEDISLPTNCYDLVVGWMVLEHLHNPKQCLKKLCDSAKSDGWLVLSVPNAESSEFKFFGDHWFALQVPTHLYHYTPQSIKIILEANGWQVEKIFHQRVLANLYYSLGYYLEDQGFKSFSMLLNKIPMAVFSYTLYPLAYLASLFGQTGRMTIWAKKKPE